MTPATFNAFCQSLPHTTHVVQWNGADVWKVGTADKAKVFAVGGWHHGRHAGITFKVSPMAYEILRDAPGLRPAPYFASRGMKWIQCFDDGDDGDTGPTDAELKGYLEDSYRLVAEGLPKRVRESLGL